MDEMSKRLSRARARISRNDHCDVLLLAENFSDVPLLDFHTEKFQLRGIDLPKKFRERARRR